MKHYLLEVEKYKLIKDCDKQAYIAVLLNRLERCCNCCSLMISGFRDIFMPTTTIICASCRTSIDRLDDFGIFEAWDKMILERDRKKRDIVEVEINDYPFVYAMR